ncbi:MAG: MotA/TolQ/ExbB proton channel family protein [Candidatus Latescibacterota bacterium]|jgi:biopolymer transport protein ExbB
MRQSTFITVLLVAAFGVSLAIYWYLLPDFIRDGGPLVVGLMVITIMQVTFIIERGLTLAKAKGRGSMARFAADLLNRVRERDVNGALALCDAQSGSCASIMRAGLERYRGVSNDASLSEDRKVAEIQEAFDSATGLEIPLLERNLIALSTLASIATLVGLLGTVIGMIRCFKAVARTGAPDAIQLAVGISEALINTAGGLFAAIAGIVAYNFFVNQVDGLSYDIEEATHHVVQILTGRKQ